jgi:hypothetical protein
MVVAAECSDFLAASFINALSPRVSAPFPTHPVPPLPDPPPFPDAHAELPKQPSLTDLAVTSPHALAFDRSRAHSDVVVDGHRVVAGLCKNLGELHSLLAALPAADAAAGDQSTRMGSAPSSLLPPPLPPPSSLSTHSLYCLCLSILP